MRHPDVEQTQHGRQRKLHLMQGLAQLRAQPSDEQREARRVEVADLRMKGCQRAEAATQARHQREVAEALGVGVQRHGQDERREGEERGYQREKGQVQRGGPAHVRICNLGALPRSAQLAAAQCPAQQHHGDEREEQIVDDQRVPAEEHRPAGCAAKHDGQRQRRAQANAYLLAGQRRCQQRAGPQQHAGRNEHDRKRNHQAQYT